VQVTSTNTKQELRVDKDCVLVREHFQLDHVDYEDMSPVIIPQVIKDRSTYAFILTGPFSNISFYFSIAAVCAGLYEKVRGRRSVSQQADSRR
jgi:hypothetical protein